MQVIYFNIISASNSNKLIARVELFALAFTVLSKFIIMDWLGMRAFYIAGICGLWSWYVLFRYSLDHSVISSWGFRKKNLGKSLGVLMPFLVVCLWFMLIFAKRNHIALLNPHILPVFFLYPLWGIIQQFMMVGIVVEILRNTQLVKTGMTLVILLASILFSLIHFPDIRLMVFTFAMEVVFLTVYNKWRNLWAIGLVHGWIATFLLYYVHNRDLWNELFDWF